MNHARTMGDIEKVTRSLLALDPKKEGSHITADWELKRPLLDGVVVHPVKNVMKQNGYLVEVFRSDWKVDSVGVDQIFLNYLEPGAVAGWHAHAKTTDRIFVTMGELLIALYDDREGSPTRGRTMDTIVGERRQALVVVPPGMWHAVKNVSSKPAALLNVVDVAYAYEDPDHYRLPPDSNKIPYRLV